MRASRPRAKRDSLSASEARSVALTTQDLKADCATGKLLVLASYAEAGAKQPDVAGALANELRTVAEWLGLSKGVEVATRGNLSRSLRGAILARRAR